MAESIDWAARAVMLKLMFTTAEHNERSGFKSLAAWWESRLQNRTCDEWRRVFRSGSGALFRNTNVGKAMAKMGIEPTMINYIELVNAARKEINPRARRIKL